jgi:hypothetical protein
MSFNDLTFNLTFSPLLKTREQIQVSEYFLVIGGEDYTVALFTPFLKTDGPEQEIKADLEAAAESVTSQWALAFESADAALDPKSYRSLTDRLSAIASPRYQIRQTSVCRIVPLSDRLPEPPPIVHEIPRIERTMTQLIEDTRDYDQIRKLMLAMTERYPDLFNDTKYGERMKSKFDTKAFEILLSRRAQ